jgi:hypothetical protein
MALKPYNKFLILLGGFLLTGIMGYSQSTDHLEGRVSFITGTGIYVKFKSTSTIQLGDTLYRRADTLMKPVLVVNKKSSISTICQTIENAVLEVDDIVIHLAPKIEELKTEIERADPTVQRTFQDSIAETTVIKSDSQQIFTRQAKIRGRLGTSAHSNFMNGGEDFNQRMRYTFSLRAQNIGGSRLSSDVYMSYRHNTGPNTESSSITSSTYRIYSLSVGYDLGETAHVSLGRKINRRIANVGAIDGLQFEKQAGAWSFGAVGGFRPNISDYSIDTSLLEYGGFVSHTLRNGAKYAESSLAFFEQRNSGAVDRRFAYFQHSSSLAKGLNTFISFDVDLYQLKNEQVVNKPRLSGLYTSIRYKFNRKVSLFASYDARNNVIYYETYKIRADELLEAATRQGYRARLNLRPIKFLSLGITAGYRFQNGNPNESKNLYIYSNYSRLPWIKASLTLSANLLETAYLSGTIFAARLNKDLFRGKLNLGAHYRRVDYNFTSSENVLLQNIAGLQLNWRIIKPLSLSLSYEGTLKGSELFNRVHANAVLRF